jgi:putative glycosyltransferase (TIGR04348 family)
VSRLRILIVTPYAASANNGNWRTAARWSRLLRADHRVIVRTPGEALDDADVLIALHARRSHAAVVEWRARFGARPCVVVLTGTDLYRDVPQRDADALDSLARADRLIVLQEQGVEALPARFRARTHVVYQSAPALAAAVKPSRKLTALFVGHVRPEKDAATFVHAAARLAARRDIAFEIVGGAREADARAEIDALLPAAPTLALRGALPHAATRQRIRRAHVLVVPSRMEGGANVIVEAVTAGTPVLASDCDGNVGMLGRAYPGYFPVGDDARLAQLVVRCRDEPAFLARLARLCAARAARFAPERERRGLLRAIHHEGTNTRRRQTR